MDCLPDEFEEQTVKSIGGMEAIEVKTEPPDEILTSEVHIEDHTIKLELVELNCFPQNPGSCTQRNSNLECLVVPQLLSCDLCYFITDNKCQLATHMQTHLAPNTSESSSIEENIELSGDEVNSTDAIKTKEQELITNNKKQLNSYNRQRGLPYKGLKIVDGKSVTVNRDPRTMGPRCKSAQCKKIRQCSLFSEAERNKIFTTFWRLSLQEKKDFLRSLVDVNTTKPSRNMLLLHRETTRRSFHLKFKGSKRKVCQLLFLSTLGLKYAQMTNWLDPKKDVNKPPQQLVPKPSRPCRRKEKVFIRETLNKLPRVPSHFCPAIIDKEFLQSDFKSLRDVHRFVTEEAKSTPDVGPITWSTFFSIFKSMNLAVHQLRKDSCDVCTSIRIDLKHENLTSEEKAEIEKKLDEHIKSYREAMAEKKRDKRSGPKTTAWVCDLQKVFSLPHLTTNTQYYLMKFQVRNWTTYNLKKSDATCRVWDETQGSVDTSDFASLWCDFVEEQIESDPDLEELIAWSDGCCSQNRNVTLANVLLTLAIKHKIIITQKFLVHGHTFNEGNVFHSGIEHMFQNTLIYSMEDCIEAIKGAQIQSKATSSSSADLVHPFRVRVMNFTDFKDYQKLSAYLSIHPGVGEASPNTVNQIRAMQYHPNGNIKYKLNFNEDWKDLPHKNPQPVFEISDKYISRIPVNPKKYQHLQQLKIFMPPQHHKFYEDVPVAQ
ncbi:hypothetical protein B566_EDAN013681 [Ephemera danica]|nr:hypothetical protein B566_EDAN013681 [Ephemera danica]